MADEFFIKKLDISNPTQKLRCIGRVGDFLYWLPKNNVLLKTDANFNTIWQKEISGPTYFQGVYQASTNDDILVQGSLQELGDSFPNMILMKLDNSGNIVWFKKYENARPLEINCILTIPGSKYAVVARGYVFTIDENGNVIDSKLTKDQPARDYSIDGIQFRNNQIYVVGNTFTLQRIGAILVLNTSLNLVTGFRYFIQQSFSGFTSGRYTGALNNQLYLSVNSEDKKVICSFDMDNNLDVLSTIELNKSIDVSPQGNFVNSTTNNIYVYGQEGTDSVIYKLSSSLSILWAKRIGNLEIVGLNFRAYDNYMIIVPDNDTSVWDKKTVIKTDENLVSDCVAVIPDNDTSQNLSATKENYTFFVEPISINISSPSVTFNDFPLYPTIQKCPPASLSTSTINASPTEIEANGISVATVIVQLKDSAGVNITTSGGTVVINTTSGTIGSTNDNGDGTYSATLTSPTDSGIAELSFTVDATPSANTATVNFEEVIKVKQEYFIKKYENTFTEDLEFIGENKTSLFWTHRVVGSQGHILLVTDRNFNPILVKNFNETEVSGPATLQKVVACPNGDVLILGNYLSNNAQLRGPFVIRLTEVGSVVWIKRYNTTDGLAGNSESMEFHSLNNGLYVLNNANPAVLFTIDEQGSVVNVVDKDNFPIVDSLVVHNQNIYGCTRDGSNPNTSLFGIAKFDLTLNLLDFTEYNFSSDLGANPTSREAFIIEDSLIISTTINTNGNNNIYLAKVDLSTPFPAQLNAKFFTVDHVLFQFAQSSNNLFIKYNEQGGLSSKVILRLDENLNFSSSPKIPSESIRDFYAASDALYFTLSSYRMVKTSQSFYSNCFAFDNGATPILQDVVLTKDSSQTYAPPTLALQSFDFTLNTTDVTFTDFEELCTLFPRILQSPNLYLQAAGSTGSDGTASGIHLRWLLKKNLINHLPKGNLASSSVNHNKPNDFVTIYRAPYTPSTITIDFAQPPKAVENRNALWIYLVDGQSFYLYFRNKTKYATVRGNFNPLTQPAQFIQSYGSDILEFRTSSDLFFTIGFSTSSTSTAAKVETEILSVEGSTALLDKQITARKAFVGSELLSAQINTENGKGLRFRPTNCQVTSIDVELYGVLSDAVENGTGWTELGQFALSESDTEVFDRLEPSSDLVNGSWPRYNDDALVKIQNYKNKWNQQSQSTFSSIKQTVQDYVALSDVEDNPTALETFSFDPTPPPGATAEDNTFELPNLMLLQQAAMDYHVARMLGLGHLDITPEVQNNDSFIYMAVYETAVSLVDGELIAEDTEHRFITAPINKNVEKLPVAVDLKAPVPGVFLTNGIGEDSEPLTDDDGYTLDGKARFVTLYAEEPAELSQDRGFYHTNAEFNIALETFPVVAGIEYKKTGEADWRRPELPNTPDYQNAAPNGQTEYNETVALPIPDEGTALFIHRETQSGEHIYSSYGVNWFSRITRSVQEYALTTTIQPANTLLPPSDRSALLVIEEQPLMLTTANEQQMLSNITGADKSLVRLMFNYNTEQELQSYRVTDQTLNGATDALDPNAIFPDDQEVFADEIEMYFRDSMPLKVTGKAITITDHPSIEILSIIDTGPYVLDSTGESVSPTISMGEMGNFTGGILVLEDNEYIIYEVTGDEATPTITVYKKQISDKLQKGSEPNPAEGLSSPKINSDGRFLAVENLQNVSSWGTPNPHPLKVQVGDNWSIHREVITRLDPDGNTAEYLQKTRGIWDYATIEREMKPENVPPNERVHLGHYKATFGSVMLSNHPQNSGANPVQWYKGIMRVHTVGDPNGERRGLEVYKIENIGTGAALVVYFKDKDFRNDPDHDEIQIGGAVQVNFYPGYRVHLFANVAAGISEDRILPDAGEGIKYTCFGFRSINNAKSYYSRIAVPTVMFAQEVVPPLVPQLPVGALYATRPDSFGKATYTITTQFVHTPHGILYYRADDDALLNALYTPTTIAIIKEALADSDPAFLPNRWQNLLGFDYDYPANSFQTDGLFGIYPETAEGYRLPNPDNPALFDTGVTPGSLTPGSMVDKIKEGIFESFVPLTEVPLLYESIKGEDYEPIPKKQVIRDRNGYVLKPTDPEFDIAPMAKKLGGDAVRFVDFTLDGTSNNIYFYSAKELSNTMQMSDFSPILGPIKLVNTNPPNRPAIRQMVPILENTLLGIPPQMEVSVNAFPKVENIKKLSLYRASNATDALSIRTMELVKEINLETLDVLDENIWRIADGFEDLTEVPFGDPLFYRVIVSREIEYPNKNDDTIIITEYVPSESSKLVVTTIVENTNPVAPELSFAADPVNANYELDNVVLSWEKTAYNAKYYLYKLNNQGQWVKIHEVTSDEQTITVPLDTTDLGSNILSIEDSENDNQSIYHQFKVVAENTSGLLSQEETILTIPSTNEYDGIGGMGVEQTFIIR